MGSPFGPLAVIAEPTAGGGRIRDQLDAVRTELDARGLEHRIWIADPPGDAGRIAAEARSGGHRFVVAVGADQLVHDVVNGLVANGHADDEAIVLGLVAAGASCDLVKTFGLPSDPAGACAHLVGEETYPLDLIRVTSTAHDGSRSTRYAHNVAEVGLGAEVTARVAAGRGRFASFWRSYLGYRVPSMRIGIDAKPDREVRAWNLVIGNGQFSSGLRLSPRSFPGDGILDVLAFTGPKSDAYRMLPAIYRHGDHVPDPGIEEMRGRIRVGVDASRPLLVVADGRSLGTTPATFQPVVGKVLLKL